MAICLVFAGFLVHKLTLAQLSKVENLQTNLPSMDLNVLDCSPTQLINKYQTGYANISAGHTFHWHNFAIQRLCSALQADIIKS